MRRTFLLLLIIVFAVGLMASLAVAQTEPVTNTVEGEQVAVAPIQVQRPSQVAGAVAQEGLPVTGFDTAVWAAVAAGLVILGGGAVAVSRRSRAS